jgi:hypothetical protein
VQVPAHNVANNKLYADTYRAFVREAVIPEAILERAYRSRYARHFYSASEIDRFRRSWQRDRVR